MSAEMDVEGLARLVALYDGATCAAGEESSDAMRAVERLRSRMDQFKGLHQAFCRAVARLKEQAEEIGRLKGENVALIEDRARFPDKPDGIGRMISAHIGNLKAVAESDRRHARRAMDERDSLARQLQEAVEERDRLRLHRDALLNFTDSHGIDREEIDGFMEGNRVPGWTALTNRSTEE